MPTFYNVTSTGADARALQVPTAAGRAVTSGVEETNCEFTSKKQLVLKLTAKMGIGLNGGEVMALVARLNSTDTSGWADPTYFLPSTQPGTGSGSGGAASLNGAAGGSPLVGSTIAVGD